MVIFATLFRRCSNVVKIDVGNENAVQFNEVVSTFLKVVNFNADVHNVVSTLI